MVRISQMNMAFKKKIILNRIDLKVNKGEIFGIAGVNGSGKTILIKVLATLLRPTGGKVEIGGYDIVKDRKRVRLMIGYMPDTVGFNDKLTVKEYLDFFRSMYGRYRREDGLFPDELLEAVGLYNMNDIYLQDLSRGEQQRISLTRSIIHDPSVLLLDNPDVGIDLLGLEKMLSLLRDLSDKGKTIILTSHSISLLNRISNRIGIIHEGRIVWTFSAGVESAEAIKNRIRGFKIGTDESGNG